MNRNRATVILLYLNILSHFSNSQPTRVKSVGRSGINLECFSGGEIFPLGTRPILLGHSTITLSLFIFSYGKQRRDSNQAGNPNSYSYSPKGGTSNLIRPKAPILCDAIFAKSKLALHGPGSFQLSRQGSRKYLSCHFPLHTLLLSCNQYQIQYTYS